MRQQPIHLINPLRNRAGGSEWRTLNLGEELRQNSDLTIWSTGEPDPSFAGIQSFRQINARALAFPKSGTFVFVGVYFTPGRWIWAARPSRVIVVYNTPDLPRLRERLQLFMRAFRCTPEIVYASEMMRDEAGLPGIVEPSLIDLVRFAPKTRPSNAAFTIGRLSRSVSVKHHPNDLAFYRLLAGKGCAISVMGATDAMIDDNILKDQQGAAISLLPAGARRADAFLAGLDCFFYRTAESWREPWGRVVLEAMSCGLPIVAERRGGYCEIIDDGRNGFLFDTEGQAEDILLRLKNNPALRASVGVSARQTVETILSQKVQSRIVKFYTQRTDKRAWLPKRVGSFLTTPPTDTHAM